MAAGASRPSARAGRPHGAPPYARQDERLAAGAAARRDRQGRHRQDDGRRLARARTGLAAASRCCSARPRAGRASPGSSTCPAAVRGALDRAAAPDGGEVKALAIDPEAALLRVPGDVLPPRPRRSGARPLRRRRLRHHHRPRPARRAADRQGLRGVPAHAARTTSASTTPSCSTPRRPGASRASSTSTPRWPGWPRSGPSATRPTRSWGAALAAHRRAPGHPARGHAGPGDARRGRASCAATGLPVGGHRGQPGAPLAAGRRHPQGARRGPAGRRRPRAGLAAAGLPGRGSDVTVDALAEGAARGGAPSTSSGWTLEEGLRETVEQAGRPVYTLPQLDRRRRPRRRCTSSPSRCANRGWHERRRTPATRARRRPAAPGRDSSPRVGPLGGRSRPAGPFDVDALLDDRGTQIIVCCGSGGVGKTTTAAALALRAAERGRSVVVLTIDPARRLAQSLGLNALDNTPAAGRRRAGVTAAGGRLDAMMLDMKRTFDEVVEAHASPAEGAADPGQPVLRRAVQLVRVAPRSTWRWRSSGSCTPEPARTAGWDLIVVDTPPSRSALDFLDAPEHLSSLLDGRFIRLLLAPARGPARLLSAGPRRRDRRAHQGAGRAGPARRADVRRGLRHAVRRVPAARRAHVRAAAGAADRVRRGGDTRARRAAGGGLLRGAAERGPDAAGRPGAEPGHGRRGCHS